MLSFDLNNDRMMTLSQTEHDKKVIVSKIASNGDVEEQKTIPAGQFVMLMNLYTHIMENNIQNDFINPYGKNKEV